MSGLSRRAFLGATAGGLTALYAQSTALAAVRAAGIILPSRDVDVSNALNLGLFLHNQDTLSLAGVMSTGPVDGALGSYAPATLLLFPFHRGAAGQTMRAFLPARDTAGALIAAEPMTPSGLPPDEYYCNYVLKAARQSFIGFSVDPLPARGTEKRPWYTDVDDVGNGAVRIGWTSANLNHPRFEGSHWIPDGEDGDGKYWRARIITGVRQVSAMAC